MIKSLSNELKETLPTIEDIEAEFEKDKDMNPKKHKPLEGDLEILLTRSQKGLSVSIEEILKILSGKSRALSLIFLSLPFCQPMQIPGFSTPFGILIAFMGLCMVFGKRLWLPKRILLKTVSSATLQKIADKGLHLVKKMKRFMRPRLTWICHHPIMKLINGFLVVILGILLAFPLPIPFSNLAAAWSIFLIGLGILEDDGIIMVIGYLVSLLTFIFFTLIIFSIKTIF